MTRLDQLLYTWAARGPGGHSGFQPIAATDRLSDSRSTLTRVAVQLCRYDPPRGAREPGQMPVSYGWIDHGPMRIVFRRSYAGNDAFGRPGNFCAHIVTGPREALPVAELVGRLCSPFWWDGAAADAYAAGDLTLEPVTPADLAPGPAAEADPELLVQLVDAVLTPRLRIPLVLESTPEQATAVWAAVGQRLPGLLETVPFSTYEAQAMAARFHVVGSTGPEVPANAMAVSRTATSGRPEPLRRARELILSATPTDRNLVAMCVASGDGQGGLAGVARIGTMISLFDRLRSAGRIDVAAIAAVLNRPMAADLLLAIPAAVEAIATDLTSSQPGLWPCLGEVAAGIPDSKLSLLGAAVGEKAACRGPVCVDEVVRAAGDQLPPAFAEACALTVLDRAAAVPGLLDRLSSSTILRMLRYAAISGEHGARDGVEALLAAGGAFPDAADEPRLPVSWRGGVLAYTLARKPGSRQAVTARLNREPGLAGPLAARRPGLDQLTEVLSGVSSGQLPACVIAAGAELPAASRGELAAWCGHRLPPRERLGFLTAFAPLVPPRDSGGSWAALVVPVVHDWTGDALQTLYIDPVPSGAIVDLLAGAGADRAACSWRRLVEHVSRYPADEKPQAFRRWTKEGLETVEWIAGPARRGVSLDLFLFAVLRRRITWTQFSLLADDLGGWLPGGPEEAVDFLLIAARRVASWNRDFTAGIHCLVQVARLIDSREIRTGMKGNRAAGR